MEEFRGQVMHHPFPAWKCRRNSPAYIMTAGGVSWLPVFDSGIYTVSAINSGAALLIYNIVLAVVSAVFAGGIVHDGHLILIIEFITLKVNRV